MLATVASLTSANRIKRRSTEFGIYVGVIQTPQSLSREGCGYSIRFDDNAKEIIHNIASDLRIKIRSFYKEAESDGKKTYIKL